MPSKRLDLAYDKMLHFHAQGILAWYDYPISTGPLEGTNNKIKTMKPLTLKSDEQKPSNH